MNLIEAAGEGDFLEVQRLVNLGADIHEDNDQALIEAVETGDLRIVEFLINHGADIHAKEDQAIFLASIEGNLPIVKFLVSRGADIHTRGEIPLHYAVLNFQFEVAEYLMEHGAVITDNSIREAALYHDEPEPIKFLFDHGANPNILSLSQRQQYQDLIPPMISTSEYFQLELGIEKIRNFSDRYILSTGDKSYVLNLHLQ